MVYPKLITDLTNDSKRDKMTGDWWCTFYGRVEAYPPKSGKYMRCPLCNKRLELLPKYCNCCTPNVLVCYSVSQHKIPKAKRKGSKK